MSIWNGPSFHDPRRTHVFESHPGRAVSVSNCDFERRYAVGSHPALVLQHTHIYTAGAWRRTFSSTRTKSVHTKVWTGWPKSGCGRATMRGWICRAALKISRDSRHILGALKVSRIPRIEVAAINTENPNKMIFFGKNRLEPLDRIFRRHVHTHTHKEIIQVLWLGIMIMFQLRHHTETASHSQPSIRGCMTTW